MGGLFAALALLSVVLSRINLAISRSLHKNKRSALLHVFEHLQLELMLLGMLSLLLQVAQGREGGRRQLVVADRPHECVCR